MTAINVLLTESEVHVFSDGGHYDAAGNIVRVGAKTLHLPRYDALLAFSGPSGAIPAIIRRIEELDCPSLSHLCAVAEVTLAGVVPLGLPYSIIIAGIENGIPIGIAVEERGVAHWLGIGSMIRSLECSERFDIGDVVGSGRRMITEQRALYGVVAGFCLHTKLTEGGLFNQVLDRWPIVMAQPSPTSFAAKIANLEVDTINIANNAALAVATGSTVISAPNPMAASVKVFAFGTATYQNSGASGTVQFQILVRASVGSRILAIYSFSRSGSSGGGPLYYDIPLTAIDLALYSSETYSIETQTFASAPGAGITIVPWSNLQIKALYRKR